jgi:hypothetical protein
MENTLPIHRMATSWAGVNVRKTAMRPLCEVGGRNAGFFVGALSGSAMLCVGEWSPAVEGVASITFT